MKNLLKNASKIALLSSFAIASNAYSSDDITHGFFTENSNNNFELIPTDLGYKTPEEAIDDFSKFCVKAIEGEESNILPSVQSSLKQISDSSDFGSQLIDKAAELDLTFCMHSAIPDGTEASYQYKFNLVNLRQDYTTDGLIHEIAHALQNGNGLIEADPEWDLKSNIRHVLMFEATAPVASIIYAFEMKLNGDDSEWNKLIEMSKTDYTSAISPIVLKLFEATYQNKIKEGDSNISAIEAAGNSSVKTILMNKTWKNAYINSILNEYIKRDLNTPEIKTNLPKTDQISSYGDFGKYNVSKYLSEDLFVSPDTSLLKNISKKSKDTIKFLESYREERMHTNKISPK